MEKICFQFQWMCTLRVLRGLGVGELTLSAFEPEVVLLLPLDYNAQISVQPLPSVSCPIIS